MNSPVIFYHLWPVGEYNTINKNIFTEIVNSKLANSMEKMYICVNIDIEDINLYGLPKDKVEIIKIKDTNTEWPTLEQLYIKYVNKENTPILYLHCKGARFNNSMPQYEPINSWTKGMTYFNVTKWKKNISMLEQGKLTCGIRVERVPSPHYSGNFWWMNSSILKNLADPRRQDQTIRNRYGAEFWIGGVGLANLNNTDSSKTLFNYVNIIYPEQYVNSSVKNKEICVYDVNGNLSWLNNQDIDYTIYSKKTCITNNSIVEAYIKYIVDNYDELPKYVYFLKSDAITKIPNLLIILKNNYIKFNSFGGYKTKDNKLGLPNHPGLDIAATWSMLFEDECPDEFNFTAGSNFGVTSDEIKKYSKKFYEKILAQLSKVDDPIEDYRFERLWKEIFTVKHTELKNNINNYDVERDRITMPDTIRIDDEIYNNTENIIEFIYSQINNNIKYVMFLHGSIEYHEFYGFMSTEFREDNFEYYDRQFSSWKLCVISTEYLVKNKTKKKKIIQPLEQHIREFML